MRRKQNPSIWKSAAARRIRELAGTSTDSVEAAIRLIVAKLLIGIESPPTDLDQLCARLDVAAVEEGLIPVAGELLRDASGYRIICGTGQPEPRRRFTIAHEMAHIIFERSGPGFPRTGAELERLCDMIAAEILMPTAAFSDAVKSLPLNAKRVSSLASTFQTSLTATAIRCADFKPVSIFMVERGRLAWARGPVRPQLIKGALERLMRQAFDGEKGDRFVFVTTDHWRGVCEADWIKTRGDRAALFVLNQTTLTAARAALTKGLQ